MLSSSVLLCGVGQEGRTQMYVFFLFENYNYNKKYLLIFTARISERISEGMGKTQALASENNTPAIET